MSKAIKIDLDEIIKAKNPKLAKLLPNFIISIIKKIVHQEEFNYILNIYKDEYGIDMVHAIIKYFNIKIKVHGIESIDKNKRYIFAANHPLGSLEGQALLSIVYKEFGDVKFIANDILMYLKNYESLLIPVNKHGKYSKENAKITNEAYSSNIQMLVLYPMHITNL